jgi:hypothetical protein
MIGWRWSRGGGGVSHREGREKEGKKVEERGEDDSRYVDVFGAEKIKKSKTRIRFRRRPIGDLPLSSNSLNKYSSPDKGVGSRRSGGPRAQAG